MSNGEKHYAITRIDISKYSTHGWEVRLQRKGEKYAKFFSDSLCKNRENALRLAIEYRNALLSQLASFNRRERAQMIPINNRSGVVGVSRIRGMTAKGVRFDYWQATWSPQPGKRKRIKFSIKRYGYVEAFQRACQARERGVQEMRE